MSSKDDNEFTDIRTADEPEQEVKMQNETDSKTNATPKQQLYFPGSVGTNQTNEPATQRKLTTPEISSIKDAVLKSIGNMEKIKIVKTSDAANSLIPTDEQSSELLNVLSRENSELPAGSKIKPNVSSAILSLDAFQKSNTTENKRGLIRSLSELINKDRGILNSLSEGTRSFLERFRRTSNSTEKPMNEDNLNKTPQLNNSLGQLQSQPVTVTPSSEQSNNNGLPSQDTAITNSNTAQQVIDTPVNVSSAHPSNVSLATQPNSVPGTLPATALNGNNAHINVTGTSIAATPPPNGNNVSSAKVLATVTTQPGSTNAATGTNSNIPTTPGTTTNPTQTGSTDVVTGTSSNTNQPASTPPQQPDEQETSELNSTITSSPGSGVIITSSGLVYEYSKDYQDNAIYETGGLENVTRKVKMDNSQSQIQVLDTNTNTWEPIKLDTFEKYYAAIIPQGDEKSSTFFNSTMNASKKAIRDIYDLYEGFKK